MNDRLRTRCDFVVGQPPLDGVRVLRCRSWYQVLMQPGRSGKSKTLLGAFVLASAGFAGVVWWLQAERAGHEYEAQECVRAEGPGRSQTKTSPARRPEGSSAPVRRPVFRPPVAQRGDGGPEAADDAIEEVELQPGQLRALDQPWHLVLKTFEDDLMLVVEKCLEENKATATPAEGLALDFVYEPKRGEAGLSEVRFHEESNAQPAGVVECLEGLLKEGPIPLEVADGLDDGTYTLRLGPNRTVGPE